MRHSVTSHHSDFRLKLGLAARTRENQSEFATGTSPALTQAMRIKKAAVNILAMACTLTTLAHPRHVHAHDPSTTPGERHEDHPPPSIFGPEMEPEDSVADGFGYGALSGAAVTGFVSGGLVLSLSSGAPGCDGDCSIDTGNALALVGGSMVVGALIGGLVGLLIDAAD